MLRLARHYLALAAPRLAAMYALVCIYLTHCKHQYIHPYVYKSTFAAACPSRRLHWFRRARKFDISLRSRLACAHTFLRRNNNKRALHLQFQFHCAFSSQQVGKSARPTRLLCGAFVANFSTARRCSCLCVRARARSLKQLVYATHHCQFNVIAEPSIKNVGWK